MHLRQHGHTNVAHRHNVRVGIEQCTYELPLGAEGRYVDPANIAKASLEVQRGPTYLGGGLGHGTDHGALARVRTRSEPRKTALQSAVLRID